MNVCPIQRRHGTLETRSYMWLDIETRDATRKLLPNNRSVSFEAEIRN